jgi:hypothetical protein
MVMQAALGPEFVKRMIRRLDNASFCKLVDRMLVQEYEGVITHLPQFGPNVWHRWFGSVRLKYGREERSDGFYIAHHLPSDLFSDPLAFNVRQPGLATTLQKILFSPYIPELDYDAKATLHALYFLNNTGVDADGNDPVAYANALAEKYYEFLVALGFDTNNVVSVGTCDNYVDQRLQIVVQSLTAVLDASLETSIRLVTDEIEVQPFIAERHFSEGVTAGSLSPCGPVYIIKRAPQVIREFEALLQGNPSEAHLESFLKTYYREVFGPDYDRVETQVWVRFPHLDVTNKRRRLDMFLRNQVTRDWELHEIKRMAKLTGTYRDAPILSREVLGGLRQLRNYARILRQDEIKRSFAREGIDYYEPELRLVVGKGPDISLEQWRTLLAENKDVKIITYPALLEQMKIRENDRFELSSSMISRDREARSSHEQFCAPG